MLSLKNKNYLTELNNKQLIHQQLFYYGIRYYQEIAKRVFETLKNINWILLEYGPGVGKTRTFILMILKAIEETKFGLYRKIIIIGQDSLKKIVESQFEALGLNLNDYKDIIYFYTYQKLINRLFILTSNVKRNFIDTEYFKNSLEKGYIQINNNIIDDLKHSIVIIDEFQKLYRSDNINSYGYTIRYLIENNYLYKIILLSGTILNSRINELEYILYILGEEDNIDNIKSEKYFNYIDNIVKIKDAGVKKFLDIFLEHSLCYQFNEDTIEAEYIYNGVSLFTDSDIKVVKCPMSIKQTEYVLLKQNYILDSIDDINEDYNKNTDENINQQSNNINLFQKKYYYTEEDYEKNHIFHSNEVKLSELKKNSPIAYKFLSDIFDRLKKSNYGKTVAYNININNNFGLEQYKIILKENGFHMYGDSIVSNNKCMYCLEEYKDHKTDDHLFTPITFTIIDGQLTEYARYNLRTIFNSKENLYGSKIYLLLLSEVGETSITLEAVNYFYLLSYIPSFSRMEQLFARTNRAGTHINLPDDKKFVEINILIPTFNTTITSELSPDEKYFITLENNNKEIKKFLYKLRDKNLIANIEYGKYDKNQFNPYLLENITILETYIKDYFSKIEFIDFNSMYKIIVENKYNYTQLNFNIFSKYTILYSVIKFFKIYNFNEKKELYEYKDSDFDKLIVYNPNYILPKKKENKFIEIHDIKFKNTSNINAKTDFIKDLDNLMSSLNNRSFNINIKKILKPDTINFVLTELINDKSDLIYVFMYNNYMVYCEGDDNKEKYIENHLSLFSDCPVLISCDEYINYIKKNNPDLRKKIKGILFSNNVYMLDNSIIPINPWEFISSTNKSQYRVIVSKDTKGVPILKFYNKNIVINIKYKDKRRENRGCDCLTTDNEILNTFINYIGTSISETKLNYKDILDIINDPQPNKILICRYIFYYCLFFKIINRE